MKDPGNEVEIAETQKLLFMNLPFSTHDAPAWDPGRLLSRTDKIVISAFFASSYVGNNIFLEITGTQETKIDADESFTILMNLKNIIHDCQIMY